MRLTVLLLVATILTVALGCDKTKQREAERAFADWIDKVNGRAAARKPPPPKLLDLAAKPPVLFQVFGEVRDPRIVPIGVVEAGRVRPINLTRRGWQQFERVYTAPGTILELYQDGRRTGTARVVESMWQGRDSALYSLPGCRVALPVARVSLQGEVGGRQVVEALASNGKFGRARDVEPMSPEEVRKVGREIALLAGSRYGISPRSLDSLDSRMVAVPTGTSKKPTIVIAYTNGAKRTVDTSITRGPRQLLLLADVGEFGYHPTYRFYQTTTGFSPEFRRYIDHLDLDGDGADELLVEASVVGVGTAYNVLEFSNDRWFERYRSDPNWCLDRRLVNDESAE
jgi:hypothetical protein